MQVSTHRSYSLNSLALALSVALVSHSAWAEEVVLLAQADTQSGEGVAPSRASNTDAVSLVELPPIQVKGVNSSYKAKNTSAGSRTDTPIERIPQSIVVVPKSMIEDQGVTTLSDALRNVSNVSSIDERNANIMPFMIRGFYAATVVDDVAMPGYTPDQESLANVDRIDVIKGPTGALFGSAQGAGNFMPLGGTIAITTVKPNTETATSTVGVRLGSFSEKAANFDFNHPLNSTFAVRIAGEVSDKNSETSGVFFKKKAVSPSLAWTPNSDTEVVLRGRFLDSSTLDYSGLPTTGTLTNAGFTLSRSFIFTSAGLPPTTDKAQGINLQWNQNLNEAWKLSVVAAYNQTTLDERGVFGVATFDPTANPYGCYAWGTAGVTTNSLCGIRMWEQTKTTTLSPSLTTKFDLGTVKHTVNFGLDYENTTDNANMLYSNGTGYLANLNVANPVSPAWVEPVVPATPQMTDTYKSNVAYVQEQADVGKLHLLGSIRYSTIDVTDLYGAMGVNNVTSNRKTTPRVGATYEFTNQISTFLGFSEGIKVPILALYETPPKPEKSKQTEIGLRLKDLGGISATLAYFDLTRENATIGDPNNPGFSIQEGVQQSRGVDLDLRWQITSEFTGLAAISTQTAKDIQDTNAALVNTQLFDVPKQTARIAGRYDIQRGNLIGLGFGFGLTYSSSLPGNSTNTFFTPAATIADAQLSYKARNMRFGLNINNLFDKKYYSPSNYFLGGQVIPALPLTFSTTATFSF